MTSPRTGWSCWSLTITGRVLPLDLEVDQRRAVHEHLAQDARVDLEGRAVAVACRRRRRRARARRGAGGAWRGVPRSARSSTARVGRLESAIRRASVAGGVAPTCDASDARARGGATTTDSIPTGTGPPDRGGGIGRSAPRAPATPARAPPTSRARPRSARRGARAPPPRGRRADGRDARPHEGRGDEDRPARLLHRHRVPAARVPRALPGAARLAAHRRRRRCRGRRWSACSTRSGTSPCEELFEDFDHEAAAAASIGQVHRAVLPRRARRWR